MEIEDLDPDTRNEIKYKILKVKYTRDDPVLQAQMLLQLIEAYKQYNLKVPKTIVKYIKEETKIIEKKLQEQLAEKKKLLDKKLKKKQK